jgi:hypothetical protein
MGWWTGRRCTLSTLARPCSACSRSRGSAGSLLELVVLRGANAPDALPRHERRLDAEIAERYGPAVEPPGPPGTPSEHALKSLNCANRRSACLRPLGCWLTSTRRSG